MAFTGQLGKSDSRPGNIELGSAGAASPPPPPPPSTATDPEVRLGPQHPLHLAGGLPVSLLRSNPGISPFALTLFISPDVVSPQGSVVAAAAARQVYLPTFAAPASIRGPWQDYRFGPSFTTRFDFVAAPATPTREVLAPPVGRFTATPGPWNHFGRDHAILPGAMTDAPVVPPVGPPPPPPPPQSGVFGPSRHGVPAVPRAPKVVDERVRPHIDKVAELLNDLLRRGFIRLSGGNYEIVGGGVVLPRAPTPQDDASLGAVVGQTFVDTLNNNVYVCTNNSLGSAVWRKMTLS